MSKNPANRNAADHLKQGVKNIKTTYDALYNRKGPGGGATTVPNNVKLIATGRTDAGMPKQTAKTRVGLAAMGAASVTPVGPVAAFAMGVKKSVNDKDKAVARQQANAAPATKQPAATGPKLKIKANAAPGTAQGNAAPATTAKAPAPGGNAAWAKGAKPGAASGKPPVIGNKPKV